ncbi:hypothetical protein [Nostoc sp. MS1]|uniref:hypothetical protein n=1 Tax=Nostoc sp. MS1 TaxID=2764711 RepID=UPI001CC3994E|nr:hypothetical protein [Nostoc sp. MS1]BCL35233.1 hypothetical protein NSMS1_16800 [Nostoc sp. MS1]
MSDAIALGAVIDYLVKIGIDKNYIEELEISHSLFQKLQIIFLVRINIPNPAVAIKGRHLYNLQVKYCPLNSNFA